MGQTGQVVERKHMRIVGGDHQIAFLARKRPHRRHVGIDQILEQLRWGSDGLRPQTRHGCCMQIRGLVPNSTSLWTSTELWNILYVMNAQELRRLLASKGCTFETHKGGSGHVTVRRGDRKSQLPMHGSRKELGKGLVNKILKDLGLK